MELNDLRVLVTGSNRGYREGDREAVRPSRCHRRG